MFWEKFFESFWFVFAEFWFLCAAVGIYVANREINRRRKFLLEFDGVVRARLAARGFVLCNGRCDEHETGWCIRVAYDASGAVSGSVQDVVRILVGISASYVDPVSIELSQRIPENDDVLCHMLIKYKVR